MSEADIITKVKELLEPIKTEQINKYAIIKDYYIDIHHREAVDNLLNLYKKEKEKNEKITNKYNELLDAYIQELIDHKEEVEEGLKELDFLKTLISKDLLEE